MGNNDIVELMLSRQELDEMKLAYEQEYVKLKHRLEHVGTMLHKLGSNVPEGSSASSISVRPASKTKLSYPAESEEYGRRRRRKKRGPKSVWGNFILRRLRQADRPISYAEMIRDAMVIHNLPEAKRKNARASILNSAFRLRAIHGRIETVGEEGKKEKYLVLSKWLNPEGKLEGPYAEKYQELLTAAEKQESKVQAESKPEAKAVPQSAPVKAGTKSAGSKAGRKPGAKTDKPGTTRAQKSASSAKSAGKSKK